MIHFPEPNPDEWLPGYIGRISRVNNLHRTRIWRELNLRAGSEQTSAPLKTWAAPLARVLGRSIAETMTAHTLEPLLRALYPPLPSMGSVPHPYTLRAIRLVEAQAPDGLPRLCRECVQEDIGFWGFSYWRRGHQTPGVRWCMKHDCDLVDATDQHAAHTLPEECDPASRLHLPTFKSCSAVKRYADICAGLLEMADRIPVVQARFRLRKRAFDIGCRTSISGTRENISDRAINLFSWGWLVTIFPTIQQKNIGEFFSPIDGILRSGTNPANGISYAVALSSMFDSADAALIDASRSLTPAERDEVAGNYSPRYAATRSHIRRFHSVRARPTGVPQRLNTAHELWPFLGSSTDLDDDEDDEDEDDEDEDDLMR